MVTSITNRTGVNERKTLGPMTTLSYKRQPLRHSQLTKHGSTFNVISNL